MANVRIFISKIVSEIRAQKFARKFARVFTGTPRAPEITVAVGVEYVYSENPRRVI